jgi:hypothetical protein
MEPCRLQPFDPMLGSANRRLALAPVAKSGTTSAHNVPCMQSKDLGAPAAMATDELQEDAAGAHPNGGYTNLGRDRHPISLKRHRDTLHVGRQNA